MAFWADTAFRTKGRHGITLGPDIVTDLTTTTERKITGDSPLFSSSSPSDMRSVAPDFQRHACDSNTFSSNQSRSIFANAISNWMVKSALSSASAQELTSTSAGLAQCHQRKALLSRPFVNFGSGL